jgi:thiol-disulfide isomerase/thioredoxin
VKRFAGPALSGIMRGMTRPKNSTKKRHVFAALALLAMLCLLLGGCRALAPRIHYAAGIEWQTYEAGLARAKTEQKPILLLFGANWCEPCHMFAKMFEDPRVAAKAKDFVVIHVNVDEREDLDAKYARGGRSLPRVYFLRPDGVLLRAAHAPSVRWVPSRYRYDLKDPASLLAGMELAQKLASDPDVAPNEDPTAFTPAQLCSPEPGDTACSTCLKAHCCDVTVACRYERTCTCKLLSEIGGATASNLAKCGPEEAAYKSMSSCLTAQCADVCPKFKGEIR